MLNIDYKPPTRCPYCEEKVQLCENKEIYGANYGDWPYIYLCKNKYCGAYIGCQKNTHRPSGTLADTNLRRYRKQAKEQFKEVCDEKFSSEEEGHAWLSKKIGIPRELLRFNFFDKELCQKTMHACVFQLE